MDVEQVKRELPNVFIRWNGRTYTGRVTGRLNRFATVSPWLRTDGKHVKAIIGPCFEYAWETVARAVTNGTPLRTE